MSTTTTARARQNLQRQLAARQQAASTAVAALAHGTHMDDVYAHLEYLEARLEIEHPVVTARSQGRWATDDAELLARHQDGAEPGCLKCQAANHDKATLAEHNRTT